MNCYFPMTCNILTPGHIKCLQYLNEKGYRIIIGLLTSRALNGYKKEWMPFKDREFILKSLYLADKIVPQQKLNPINNIIKYNCQAIASGDGFEKEEKEAIKNLKLKVINIKLKGEGGKRYSSSKIIKRRKVKKI